MQMPTALKYLLNELIQLHLIIERRVKYIINPILLVQLNILHVLYLPLGNLILGDTTQDSSDADVIEGLDILLRVGVVAQNDVCVYDFIELEWPLEVCIALVDDAVYDVGTVSVELLAAALQTELATVVVGVLNLKMASWFALFE